jgi:hypothetical protein
MPSFNYALYYDYHDELMERVDKDEDMQKRESFTISCGLGLGGNAAEIWSKKNKKTGKTKWDKITDLATDGWELIDVTSITLEGITSEILYTFKRPIEEGK